MNIPAWPKKHKWLTLLTIMVIIVICWVAYEVVAYKFDKQKYIEARNTLNAVYSDIITKLGNPTDYNHNGGCGGFRGEFGESGPIICSWSINFNYQVANNSEAVNLKKTIEGVISANSNLAVSALPPKIDPFVSTLPISRGGAESDYYKTNKNVKCQVIYNYKSKNVSSTRQKNSQLKASLNIELSCSGASRGKYY
ncbi:MAG TPA: hypothetical protein VFW52_01870 [Candidatus Saccharimonadales bacterium]|nr:hypothetical protein [Candidatus Saccharimonadales bacterium]